MQPRACRATLWLTGLASATAISLHAAWIFFSQNVDIKGAFQSENAFYYSFYDQLATAHGSLWEGLQALRQDDLSEAPAQINAFRRFNIYQELLFALLHRAGFHALDPATFYCSCVFVVYWLGLMAMFSLVPRSLWVIVATATLYHNCLEHASHTSYMPPLRENCGVPLWFATCAAVARLQAPQKVQGWRGRLFQRLLLLLSCTGFLLAWQFACFALALQMGCVYALAMAGVAEWSWALEVSELHAASAMLSCALRFGDLWVLRSLFFWMSCTASVMGWLFRGRTGKGPSRFISVTFAAGAFFLALRHCTLWLVARSGASLEDDAHIFEFLTFRLGLRAGPLSYQAAQYEGQRSFSPPKLRDWRDLCEARLLPAAGVAVVLMLARGWPPPFLHAWLLLLSCAAAAPWLLMMRFRTLLIPHLALLGSSVVDEGLHPAAWQSMGRLAPAVRALVLALLLRRESLTSRASGSGLRRPQPGREQLMRWLKENTEPSDIVVADMGLSALVRLHVRRGVVCHPHYESAQLRDRCTWVDKLYGHRTVEEYHSILQHHVGLGNRRAFVAVSAHSCNAVDEMGRSTSTLIELEAPHRTSQRKTCELLFLMAGGSGKPRGFAPRFLSRWHAVLEVLSSPRDHSAPLTLSPQARCDFGRYLREELREGQQAAALFRGLDGETGLDEPCACAAVGSWPSARLPEVHRRALRSQPLGCCGGASRGVASCVAASAARMQEVGDLLAASAYRQHGAELSPLSPEANGFYGFSLLHEGRYLASLERFRRAAELGNSSTTICGHALAEAGLGNSGNAMAALDKVEAVNPSETCLHMRRGLQAAHVVLLPAELQNAWESYDGGALGWRSYAQSPAVEEFAQQRFSGSKLLLLGGPVQLAMALRSLRAFRALSDWPAEFWTEAGEAYLFNEAHLAELRQVKAELRAVPSPYGSWRRAFWDWRTNLTLHWGQKVGTDAKLQKYALKVLVLLVSDCAVCLFLDNDCLALRPPQELLAHLPPGGAMLSWPDLWDVPGSALLWQQLLPKTGEPLGKSQESGQLLVRKEGAAVLTALALAALFAVRMDTFLEAIYGLEGRGLLCGFGDKDAFYLAFRLLGAPYRMLAALPAVALGPRSEYVGLVQLDALGGRGLFLHGTWAKERLAPLLQGNAVQRCDFLSEAAARNLTCVASSSSGTTRVPMDRLRCQPLKLPARLVRAMGRL